MLRLLLTWRGEAQPAHEGLPEQQIGCVPPAPPQTWSSSGVAVRDSRVTFLLSRQKSCRFKLNCQCHHVTEFSAEPDRPSLPVMATAGQTQLSLQAAWLLQPQCSQGVTGGHQELDQHSLWRLQGTKTALKDAHGGKGTHKTPCDFREAFTNHTVVLLIKRVKLGNQTLMQYVVSILGNTVTELINNP